MCKILLSVLILIFLSTTNLCVLCIDLEKCPHIYSQVFSGFSPTGNKKAGTYTDRPDINSLDLCVSECCNLKSNCHVAFLFNTTCYHVKCVTSELCLPMKKQNMTNLEMMLVNTVSEDDPSWLELLKKAHFNELQQQPIDYTPKSYDFNENTNNGIFKSSPYSEEDSYSKIYDSSVNQQLRNYLANNEEIMTQGGDLQMDESIIEKIYGNLPCNVDPRMDKSFLTLCPENEECMPLSPETRKGFCSCLPDYIRNSKSKCIPKEDMLDDVLAAKLSSDLKTDVVEETTQVIKPLIVKVSSKNVRLPENETTLYAYVIPDEEASGTKYTYLWTLIEQPKGDTNGTMTDQTKDKVNLTSLSEGLYRFKVNVSGNGYYGEDYANVTVLPVKRINKAPEVLITPKQQTIKLPNSKVILDGSRSEDDDKIVEWHWELVQGPIGYQPTLPETSTLQLDDLTLPGNYTFKLRVIDSDHAENSTIATIQVLKEIDYPPEANAGDNVIVYLPQNNVTLNGSLSTDDHEITQWEWTKDSNDESKAVDMQNTRTPFLQLSKMEEGVYTFQLKVTDAKGQSSTSMVHVFVKPATNLPPAANAGSDATVNLPQTWATLNGTESKDDIKITKFYWNQISGPSNSVIANANASIANATSLTIGEYIFELTVVDDSNNNASSRVKITVIQEKNTAPVANAGGDQSIILPVSAIILNGSRSNDDLGITNYSWTRESSSLAIGTIIENSNEKPVLVLTNIVPGRYVFKLTVHDGQGLSSSDTVSIIVHPDPLIMNLIELSLTIEANVLTQSELESLEQKVLLLLGENVKLNVRELRVEQKTGHVVIIFYAQRKDNNGLYTVMDALEVERVLKEKFWRDYGLLGASIAGIRTTVCQNTCSNHGVCNAETRACMCETFWMPDVFYFWGVAEGNCDWSILYVIIGVFICFLLLSGICWSITCLCRRTIKPRTRQKQQKYALVGTHEEEISAFNRGNTISDSETDSDVLFESRNKQMNGAIGKTNGELRNGHQKYTTTRLGRRIKT